MSADETDGVPGWIGRFATVVQGKKDEMEEI